MAEKAGVSQATVSMILNRRSNVSFSAETVEKVECAARELGYELPHRKNKSNTRKEKHKYNFKFIEVFFIIAS